MQEDGDVMYFTMLHKRFLSGILILFLGMSGILAGKDQGNACLSWGHSGSFSREGHSQARIDHHMSSPRRDVARIEETGVRSNYL